VSLTVYVDGGLSDVSRQSGHPRHASQPTSIVVDGQHQPAAGAGSSLPPRNEHPQPGLAVHADAVDEPG